MTSKTQFGQGNDPSDEILGRLRTRIRELVNGMNSQISNPDVRWLVVSGGEDADEDQFLEESKQFVKCWGLQEVFHLETRNGQKQIRIHCRVSSRNAKRKHGLPPDHFFFSMELKNVSCAELPTSDVRRLYNLLAAVTSPCSLWIAPDDSDRARPKIEVFGVTCDIDLGRLNEMMASTFSEIVSELCISCSIVEDFFSGDSHDHWHDDWFPDDDGDDPDGPFTPVPNDPATVTS